MAGLGVNIDHVATIRQARRTVEPNPVWAAVEAELGGADCVTFHLRKDRRHINDRDAQLLRQIVASKLNMEMSLDAEIVDIALALVPHQATLVPENRQEITTEGGLDVANNHLRVREVTAALRDRGMIVSAFVDPDVQQVQAALEAGCQAVEIHTGVFANAWLLDDARQRDEQVARAMDQVQTALTAGVEAGLVVHAGHGLTYNNVAVIAEMDGFAEFNIGHSIVSRAVFVGLRQAVAEMKRLIAPRQQRESI